ncbi:unnamed protein product [Candidula unifasciata]|uniref:Ammonium transporter AmtB-like domain-containing protein n=1 Tax=Candidula unifasciata TaxID=100452 RepID=A0A8S3ZW71_9EUPU|nr:unnamed protein product [Candidula unifasciata]
MASLWLAKLKLPVLLMVIQITFFALFGLFVDYDSEARPRQYGLSESNNNSAVFQDVHVMIFVGFGFLMMFLRRYGFSSMGLNLLLAAITIQWSTLVGGFLHHGGDKFTVSIVSMVTSDFAAATVLISFGALLGKTSPLQLLVMALIEVIVYAVNEYIGIVLLQVSDIGGSMFIHAFGAYFGLSVARVLYSPEVEKSTKEESVYHSDMFALVGTIFLWMFWPSFNSALAMEDAQHRAVLNTYFALVACCVVTFATSSLVNKNGKFDMVHIQNATLAGGVAIGTSADMIIMPYGALIIGSVAGFLSVIGYKYVTVSLAIYQ